MKIVEAYRLIITGDHAAAEALIAELNLRTLSSMSELMSASLFVAMGRSEEAFAMLDHALEQQLIALPFSRIHPAYDPIRLQPQFTALLERMGLVQQPQIAAIHRISL